MRHPFIGLASTSAALSLPDEIIGWVGKMVLAVLMAAVTSAVSALMANWIERKK